MAAPMDAPIKRPIPTIVPNDFRARKNWIMYLFLLENLEGNSISHAINIRNVIPKNAKATKPKMRIPQ